MVSVKVGKIKNTSKKLQCEWIKLNIVFGALSRYLTEPNEPNVIYSVHVYIG